MCVCVCVGVQVGCPEVLNPSSGKGTSSSWLKEEGTEKRNVCMCACSVCVGRFSEAMPRGLVGAFPLLPGSGSANQSWGLTDHLQQVPVIWKSARQKQKSELQNFINVYAHHNGGSQKLPAGKSCFSRRDIDPSSEREILPGVTGLPLETPPEISRLGMPGVQKMLPFTSAFKGHKRYLLFFPQGTGKSSWFEQGVSSRQSSLERQIQGREGKENKI